jgi:hypothetical protein
MGFEHRDEVMSAFFNIKRQKIDEGCRQDPIRELVFESGPQFVRMMEGREAISSEWLWLFDISGSQILTYVTMYDLETIHEPVFKPLESEPKVLRLKDLPTIIGSW